MTERERDSKRDRQRMGREAKGRRERGVTEGHTHTHTHMHTQQGPEGVPESDSS